MLQLRADSPFRVVDWRWQRARMLRDTGRIISRRRDDEMVARAKRFMDIRLRASDEADIDALYPTWGPLLYAHEIRFQTDNMLRLELEARLLTSLTLEEIAAKMQQRVDTVQWYEALFFNVKDRLDNKSWIAHQVLGPEVHTGLSDREFGLLWKLFAYGGGHYVLEAVMDGWVNPVQAKKPDEVQGFCNTQSAARIDVKHCVNMMNVRTNDTYSKIAFAELRARYREIEKLAGSGSSNDAIRDNLAAMLKSLPWGVGKNGAAPSSVISLGKIDDSANGPIEQRACDAMAVRAGREPEHANSLQALPTPTFAQQGEDS